jgi:hypothetical protein
MLFPNVWQKQIPDKLPTSLQKAINRLKRCKSRQECLEKAYFLLAEKYEGSRMKTYLLIHRLFTQSLDDIWTVKGYAHCTSINFVMRVLLLKSGHFNEYEVQNRWSFVWYVSPHQYLRVRTDKGWVNVDVWSKRFGTKLGSYAHGFNS